MSTERDKLGKLLFALPVSDRAADTAPEIMDLCDKAAEAILAAGYSKHGAELAAAKRAAKTLNEVIEKQCREVLDVTGLHHLINEDGDGAWDVVWMRLHEMREELKDLKESTIWRERVRGDSWRDRAQEMDSLAQSLEVELQAAKPRQVTTVEELEALPPGSAILTARGYVYLGCKTERHGAYKTLWQDDAAGRMSSKWFAESDSLPVTVLHVGGAE